MFSEPEQKAIEEKVRQLIRIKKGTLSSEELADLIIQRRVSWFKENKDDVLEKYNGLPDEEKAYRIIFFEHMKINPKYSEMIRVGNGRIKIMSYNFCPYLEACRQLELKTEQVCREIGEPSIQEICRMINPNLRFSRNYQNIRPYSGCCEEYFEIKPNKNKILIF